MFSDCDSIISYSTVLYALTHGNSSRQYYHLNLRIKLSHKNHPKHQETQQPKTPEANEKQRELSLSEIGNHS